MKVIFIYNQHSTPEKNMIERARTEMANHIDEFVVMELEQAKQLFHVRATPAMIFIRDDWQGEHLLGEDINSELLATALMKKHMEEEDEAIHGTNTLKLDQLINREKTLAQDELLADMLEREVL